MRKPCVSFDEFSATCKSAGAELIQFNELHWRVVGRRGGAKVAVDLWPTASPGPKFRVVGRDKRALLGDHNAALAEATGKPTKPAHAAPDELTQLRKVAKLAIGYLEFDGKLLDQMCPEQAHACVDLLAALRAAGYRMAAP